MRTPSPGTTAPRDAPVRAAASLIAEVDAGARLVVGITGPGGTGKTTLLDHLSAHLGAGGLPVARDPEQVDPRSGPVLLLVDDAHGLPDERLDALGELMPRPELHLAVAYRLWPDRPRLRRLAAALEQHRAPVVLGALRSDEIADAATAAWGTRPSAEAVEEVRRMTGAQPWLVHRLLAASRPGPRAGEAPRELLDQLGYELEGMDPVLHELLVALAVGFDLSVRLPPSLREEADRVDQLVLRARHDGLLLADGELAPLIREALLENTPAYRLRSLQRSLVEAYAAEGRELEPLASHLARSGLRDRRVAEALEHSADHLLTSRPEVAAALYAEARAAGADEEATAARRAQAEWAAGRSEAAWEILTELLARDAVPDAARAVDTVAALWAERGMMTRAAEAYRWLGPARLGPSRPLAAVALAAAGDRAALPGGAGSPSPALHTAAAELLEQGLRQSLENAGPEALGTLIRASDMMTASRRAVPLPESPAVLAALVALQTGDLALADSVLEAALAGGQGGPGARPRLLLWKAWTAMQADRPDRAREAIAAARAAGRAIGPRDELLLRALEVGLARRTDDVPALVRAWQRARETVLHLPVDLFSLLPLGELVIAAARLRDSQRLEAHVREAEDLLGRLRDPVLWSVPLHWAAVQAAILAERPSDLGPHAAALVRAAEHSRPAAVLAAAGRAWVSVLAGRVDAPAVEAAARGLAGVGLTWDGSRLAGHAAVHAEDRRDMARLLACARDLHSNGGAAAEAAPAETAGPTHPRPDESRGDMTLSPREREVARLVLDGRNYREIGEAIFISPRTVEHHIARMRQRFDAGNRSELLAQLKLALADDGVPEP